MTENAVRPHQRQPVEHPGAVRWSGHAEAAVRDRIFYLARPRGLYAVPSFLNSDITGLGLCGPASEEHIGHVAGVRDRVVIADVAAYESHVATVGEPLRTPSDQTLFGLDGFFDDMLTRGAHAALMPSRFVEAGAPATLKAVRDAACSIERDDVVALVALDVSWLRDPTIDQLIAVLKTIPHPIALALGAQYNPTDPYVAIVPNLRRLYHEVVRVGLWRTDIVGALDCLAHGGLFAGIGSSGALRHLTPPREPIQIAGRFKPSVFVPDLLHYFRANTLSIRWANAEPLRCDCSVCGGRHLGRFDSYETAVEDEARAHNAAAWGALWSRMQPHPSFDDRQLWLAETIRRAIGAYGLENTRIEQAKAFKPSSTMERMNKLTADLTRIATPAGTRTP